MQVLSQRLEWKSAESFVWISNDCSIKTPVFPRSQMSFHRLKLVILAIKQDVLFRGNPTLHITKSTLSPLWSTVTIKLDYLVSSVLSHIYIQNHSHLQYIQSVSYNLDFTLFHSYLFMHTGLFLLWPFAKTVLTDRLLS